MTTAKGRPNFPPVAAAVAAVARRVKLAAAVDAGGAAAGDAVGASAVVAEARRVKLAAAVDSGGAAGEPATIELGGGVLRQLALDLTTAEGAGGAGIVSAVAFARRRDHELRRRAGELALEVADLELEVHVIVAYLASYP